MAENDIDVSVVLPCYTEERLDKIRAALTSLRKQTLEPRRVIVAVDNNPSMANLLADEFDWVMVVLNDEGRGASATRNRGVQVVDTSITAFLDDDETADPDWLRELTQPFNNPDVVGSGGTYEPDWETVKPNWFPDEFAWAVGGSYLGLPTETAPIRNVWSGNMAVRTQEFRRVGGFRTEFGKNGSISQPEDTDLCIRMSAASGKHWMYVPSAVILHDVPASRASFQFFVRRCFSEGAGKALMRNNLDSSSAVEAEYEFVRSAAFAAFTRLLRVNQAALLQALCILIGLACAGTGYAYGRTRNAIPPKLGGPMAADALRPAQIVDFELTGSLSAFLESLRDLECYRYVWVLVRHHGRPIDVVQIPAARNDIRAQLTDYAMLAGHETPSAGTVDTRSPTETMDGAPQITVVICTRERPDDLKRVLASLKLQKWASFRILVVDNAPKTDATSILVAGLQTEFSNLSYVCEPIPGLSHARNCALRNLETELVAWIDDDEVADENWLAEIVRAFERYPVVDAVAGSVVPAELETWPQWWFEIYGGHTKGRGFTDAVFHGGDPAGQNPLYPLPAFGVGANMAARTSALTEIGGFDVGLGAGTPTCGGEDTFMFSQLLLAGSTVVYQPSALTRHYHRREFPALEKQMFGYGVGLTAFYTALIRSNWRLVGPLLALLPRGAVDMFGGRRSAATSGLPEDFPRRLLWLKRRGLASGPFAYIRARRTAARAG